MKVKAFEHLTIWTGVLEILTVGGIFYGWPAYVFVLKEEEIFYDLCENTTDSLYRSASSFNLNNSLAANEVKGCAEQDTFFNMLFVIGCAVSNASGLLYGYILDKYGMLTCRIFAGVPVTIGLILMIFYRNGFCLIAGLELIAFAALGTLMTNLTLQPIWPERTSTIGSIFSGTFDGSAATFMFVKVLYDSFGVPLRGISTGLAFMAFIHWTRTFFLLPRNTMPRQVTSSYDLRNETVLKCGGSKYEDIELETNDKEETLKKTSSTSIEVLREFGKEIRTKQFLCLAIWYCLVSLRVNSFQSWFNPSLQWMFPGEKHIQSELTNIFGLTYIMSLPISPSAGAIVDCFAKRYRQSEDDDIKGRTVGVAFVCAFVSIFTAILSVLCAFKNMAVAITSQIIFSVIRTFLYAILAQAAFLLFPPELFGLIYGVLNLLNGLTTLLADPIFRFIQSYLNGDFAPVHYVLAATSLVTLFQPFVLLKFKHT